jgi:hypothetical protein
VGDAAVTMRVVESHSFSLPHWDVFVKNSGAPRAPNSTRLLVGLSKSSGCQSRRVVTVGSYGKVATAVYAF